jgi:hypothetical protein
MPDETSPLGSSTASGERSRWRGGRERLPNRAVGAAIVAGGLVFSVSLYPLPAGPQLLDLFTPSHVFEPVRESVSESRKVVDSTFLRYQFSDFSTLKLPDLVRVVDLNDQLPGFATGGLLSLVKMYGLPNLVKSLDVLQSLGPLHMTVGFSGGGVGGGGGSSVGAVDVWPALMILLEFLKQNPPDPSGGELWDFITNVFPKLAAPAPPPEARVAVAAAPVASQPIEVAAAAPPGPSAPGVAAAAVAPPAGVPVGPPAEATVGATTEAPVPASVVVPAPAPTEVSVPDTAKPVSGALDPLNSSSPQPDPPQSDPPKPDPPKPDPPKPDPPKPDPPSSPGGESGASGGGSGASGGGSSGGSGGGSSGGSGGGSSGGSGGGSSGGE